MKNALILSGGGARAAYQVGVLKAFAELLPPGAKSPFSIVCGTSAGAINAVSLAAHEGSFADAVASLETLWLNLKPQDIYRCGWYELARSTGRLALSLVNRGVGMGKPVSLLDNAPLRGLLKSAINFEQIDRAIGRGDLDAVCVTATGYHSGKSMCFYQGRADIQDWSRYRRSGRRTLLNCDHLMASSAIPTMFPANRIEFEYFGDGAMRQLAPLSPALHLGADRLFIIGVSANREKRANSEVGVARHSPSLAQLVGHMLNSAFIDSLEGDIERLDRVNSLLRRTAGCAAGAAAGDEGGEDGDGGEADEGEGAESLRFIERLVVSPTQDLDQIAARSIKALPASLRFLLRRTGATETGGGSAAASYLLFARPFVEALITLGYRDGMLNQERIAAFQGMDRGPESAPGEVT